MAAWPEKPVSKEDAALALRRYAWECPGENGEPTRTVVHSYLGFIGADHDLNGALRNVYAADDVRWVTHLLHHDLAVCARGRLYYYDVPRPERVQAAEASG